MTNTFNRREVLGLLVGGSTTLLFQTGCSSLQISSKSSSELSSISPINRSLPEPAPQVFSGDNPTRPHSMLWIKDSFTAEKRAEALNNEERAPLVVVGGGMSGLLTAYLLRDHSPLLLEQAERFGGNSKGESFRGIDYSIGAAYFVKPDEGSPIDTLYHELGLSDFTRIKPAGDALELEEELSTPHRKKQAKKLKSYLLSVLEEEQHPFPEIPILDSKNRPQLEKLDVEDFRSHLTRVLGESIDPVLNNRIEHYCWSSFGASASEISAAAGLNFFSSEFSEICVPAGGNSAVAERILERLSLSLPKTNIRASSLVYDVHDEGEEVRVSYVSGDGKARSILAKRVVLACPKFVVKRILRDIEPDRLAAISELKYRSYLVGNLCLNTSINRSFYDLYLDNNPERQLTDARTASQEQQITDVVLANYASDVRRNTVLTLYRALPYDFARPELYLENSYNTFRPQFEEQITKDILPLLGINERSIQDLRLTRWGHPLPVAAPGLIKRGVVDTLHKPFHEKIFFVEQDNWALPAFETAVTEAVRWAPQIDSSV